MAGMVALLLTACLPVLAHASDDFDAIDQADVLQKQAIKAAREGNWKVARQLAEEVLTLDVSFATAPSRLVLARALQQEENYAGALYEIRQLERLEGVVDRLLDEVASLRAEIESIKAKEERQASRAASPSVAPDRNVGIGLVAGGIAPVFLGGLFIGNDIHYASQDQESGTWAVMGAPILATGVILEVVGAALIARGGKSARTAKVQFDGVAFGADRDQVWVGVTGRF
jgi:hypothetical protein